jgi:hypothetical protein
MNMSVLAFMFAITIFAVGVAAYALIYGQPLVLLALIDSDTDMALLKRAVHHLLNQGERIDLVGDSQEPFFEIDGQPVIASQVILRAYALGMAEADEPADQKTTERDVDARRDTMSRTRRVKRFIRSFKKGKR